MKTRSLRTTCAATHICAGCDGTIPPGVEHYDHELYRAEGAFAPILHDVVFECLGCAARNGRPGVAEPDVAEQPLDLGGIA